MASAAGIGCVTRRASGAVNRGELSVKIVFPARRVGNRLHNLVASGTLSLACCGRRNVLMAHVTLGVWRGSLLAVAYPESRGVERGLHVSDMAYRNIQTGGRVSVARGANVHSKLGRDYLRGVMAFHAVQHAREREIRQTRASGNGVMAGGAIDVELVLLFEMRDMGKPDVHILSRYGDGSNHPAGFGESGVLNFLRRMTAAAPLGVE